MEKRSNFPSGEPDDSAVLFGSSAEFVTGAHLRACGERDTIDAVEIASR